MPLLRVFFCRDNLWESVIMALEKPRKLGRFLSPTLWPRSRLQEQKGCMSYTK